MTFPSSAASVASFYNPPPGISRAASVPRRKIEQFWFHGLIVLVSLGDSPAQAAKTATIDESKEKAAPGRM
jgi:hypothetical protein